MPALLLLGALVSGILLLLVSRDTSAAEESASSPGIEPDIAEEANDTNYFPWEEPLPVNAQQNIFAFLALIREAESRGDYRALYGGGTLQSYADHPYELGTWSGVKLKNGKLTTAAGAYQITVSTWRDLGGKKKFGSFDPAAQDAAALALLERRGAMEAVQRGYFRAALYACRNEWEAFDKMIEGTYPITLSQAQRIFTNHGGEIA